MRVGKANFKIRANGQWTQVWQIRNKGQPMNITGYGFELEVKRQKGANQPKFLNLVVGDGITIVDATQGKIKIDIPPQPQINTPTTYMYDLIAIVNDEPFVWLEGTMAFEPGVSYLES